MTTANMGIVPEFTMRDRLRKARETAGMDQTQFAKAIGVSRATVSNYESSDRKPREIVLRAWALATGVPVEWLKFGQQSAGPDSGGSLRVRSVQRMPVFAGRRLAVA